MNRHEEDLSIITTVTRRNRVTIPAVVARTLGIKAGWATRAAFV
jgi:bifunctional DNA-binding transcriptional regulator/antitoxin component of YhaV-PrlF toxin-antitoxin module